ncbi:hypothetical protein V6N12_018193 [Hibiscus sabdariffa]|uniref:Interferon-related developmental regulator N-terminal domain-containing protein n=1 Tax=Hibiscus sabdariffa TaxID=183260 RepID=A0ABR2BPW0_9ROSI
MGQKTYGIHKQIRKPSKRSIRRHNNDTNDDNGDSDNSRIRRGTRQTQLPSKSRNRHHNHDDDDSGDSNNCRMGIRPSRLQSKSCIRFHIYDNNKNNRDSNNSLIQPIDIDYYFTQLWEKRVAAREEALSKIVKALVHSIELDFVEENFVTMTYYCLRCIRKSRVAQELENAVYAIGLVAMITEYVGKSHEAYIDVFYAVSNGLKSNVDIIKVLECLAIVTFFGASNSDETEKAMQLTWSFILPYCSTSVSKKKEHSPAILAAAISAWTFLLTTLDGWRLSYKIWQGATSCFSNLLNEEDETVCAAAREALALISESNCMEKFSTKAKDSEKLPESVTCIQKCKYYCETINDQKLILTSQSQIIQENENLHDVFEFSPEISNSCSDELYEPEREEVQVRFYQRPIPIPEDNSLLPFVSREDKQIQKRMTKSGNSNLNKARTLLLNKKRCIREEENDYFAD